MDRPDGDGSGSGSRSWQEELLERLGIGAFRVEHESGNLLEVNEAMVRMFGFPSVESAIGHSVLGHYQDPKERQETARRVQPIIM